MKITPNGIEQHLERGLKPVYVISGDEPLQMKETVDAIRQKARQMGYLQREVFDVDKQFNWGALLSAANELSLFSDLRVLDVRLPSGAPGKEGGAALAEYAQHLPEDAILIIQAGKIDKRSQNSAWYKALDGVGVMIEVWPIKSTEIMGWIRNRLAKQGIQAQNDAIRMIAQRVEGNMLAADQEIQKLLLLIGQTAELTVQNVTDAVANSARFSVFDLIDSALRGGLAAPRCIRILSGLRAEGVLPVMLLSPIVTQIRDLTGMAEQLSQGVPMHTVTHRVWNNRKSLVSQALQRLTVADLHQLLKHAADLDQMNKGAKRGDTWLSLKQLVLGLCGVEPLECL